jgi:hypothetical protein
MAWVAAAYDERIAVVIPAERERAGPQSWRYIWRGRSMILRIRCGRPPPVPPSLWPPHRKLLQRPHTMNRLRQTDAVPRLYARGRFELS